MSGVSRPTGGAITAMHVHLIGGSVCVMLVACVWFSGIGPAVAARSEAASRRASIEQKDREASELRNQVVHKERLLSRAMQEERQSPLRLEPVTGINRRLSDVSELAAKTGLDISVIQPGQVMTQPRFEMVPVRLQGAGSFRKVALFMHQVHGTFPDMGVASVEVKGRPNDFRGGADFSLTLVWYAAPSRTTPQAESINRADAGQTK